jgi:hypothetical protein
MALINDSKRRSLIPDFFMRKMAKSPSPKRTLTYMHNGSKFNIKTVTPKVG